MPSKKAFRVNYDARVSITFCLASLLIFILDKFALKNFNLLQSVFSAPGAKGSQIPFNFSAPGDYLRLLFFVFGNKSALQLIFSCCFILPFGAQMEERYGAPAVALTTLISAFVSGALNACLIPRPLSGAASVAMMLILLSSITSFAKNEIQLSSFLTLLFCVAGNLSLASLEDGLDRFAVTSVFVQLAGALCASMAGFLTAPKTKRSASSSAKSADERLKEIDEDSPRKKSFWGKKTADDETTVIGSINI